MITTVNEGTVVVTGSRVTVAVPVRPVNGEVVPVARMVQVP
jgi:hypothetical protein